jgi:hypothetical protein
MNHETYIRQIVDLALSRLPSEERAGVNAHIMYGVGRRGVAGICYYSAWQNGEPERIPIVEICANAETTQPEFVDTVLHELGHVLAGPAAGHGADWKKACARLGLRNAKACCTGRQVWAAIEPGIRELVAPVVLTDGKPFVTPIGGGRAPVGPVKPPKPCGLGIGTRGGRSRGPGSGSRQLKLECSDCGYVVRTSRKWIDVGLPVCCCGSEFSEV